MSRSGSADPAVRPEPHKCCPAAERQLSTTSFCGSWVWKLAPEPGLLVIYCPWCGVALPRMKAKKPTLSVVK